MESGWTVCPTASFLQAFRKSRRGRVRVINERAEVTKTGGETGFLNMYHAYETLPADLKAAIDGKQIKHGATRMRTHVEVDPGGVSELDHQQGRNPSSSPAETLTLTLTLTFDV